MTEDAFRRLALGIPGAVEGAHMDHPDFRVNGRIFASLGYPADGWGMVKLTPEQQAAFLKRAPGVLQPCAGAWGRGGATAIRLDDADAGLIRATLTTAAGNLIAKGKAKAATKSQARSGAKSKPTGRSSASGR